SLPRMPSGARSAPNNLFEGSAMPRWPLFLLLALAGCVPLPRRNCGSTGCAAPCVSAGSERAEVTFGEPATLDLHHLWALAQAHNAELREAEADVEVARGQAHQNTRLPNPRLSYTEDVIGSRIARQGN